MTIGLMHYLSSIHFDSFLHVLGVINSHHQEVFPVYIQQLVLIRLGD
jgi:hypothetical protein